MFPEKWTCFGGPEAGDLLCRQGWPGTCCDPLPSASKLLNHSHVSPYPIGWFSKASHVTLINDTAGRCQAPGAAEELEFNVMSPSFPANWWHHSSVTYLAGNTPGLSNELSDPLDAGRNIACRPLLLNSTKLIQELGDNLCEISYCNKENESLGLIIF